MSQSHMCPAVRELIQYRIQGFAERQREREAARQAKLEYLRKWKAQAARGEIPRYDRFGGEREAWRYREPERTA